MRLAATLALAAFVPACTMTNEAKHGTMAVGAITAIGGAIAVGYAATRPVDSDLRAIPETLALDTEILLALALTAIGIGVFAAGAGATSQEDLAELDAQNHAAYGFGHDFMSTAPTYAVGYAADGSAVTPVTIGEEELPALPTSPAALQIAGQLRAMVRDGHCEAARTTFARLELADVAYAHAVASGTIMQACRQ